MGKVSLILNKYWSEFNTWISAGGYSFQERAIYDTGSHDTVLNISTLSGITFIDEIMLIEYLSKFKGILSTGFTGKIESVSYPIVVYDINIGHMYFKEFKCFVDTNLKISLLGIDFYIACKPVFVSDTCIESEFFDIKLYNEIHNKRLMYNSAGVRDDIVIDKNIINGYRKTKSSLSKLTERGGLK